MNYLALRLLSAFLSGIILSQTGSLTQLTSKNILASPSTLGFDGLCILWILFIHSCLLFFGQDLSQLWIFLLGIPPFLILGWVYSAFILKVKNIERLILVGLTFNLLVGGIFSLWQFFFMAFNQPFPVEVWFGHFRYAYEFPVFAMIFIELLILGGLYLRKKELQVFSMGKTIARYMGPSEKHFFLFVFCAISLGTYTVISLFGAFSFLGLIFPIISRKIFFPRFDLKGEFLLGAFLNGVALMTLDYLCYSLPIHGAEIPVGLIAILVGAVSLICLLWQSSYWKMWQR